MQVQPLIAGILKWEGVKVVHATDGEIPLTADVSEFLLLKMEAAGSKHC
jgi:hypothetical protein